MSKKLIYQDADGEKVKLNRVSDIQRRGQFFEVTYTPAFSTEKTTMVRKDRVIRYDI